MISIPYQKISGAGNTFIVIDGREMPGKIDLPQLSRIACSDTLEHGGADGLIVIAESSGNDFEMKYFNRDGSTGMMCGNGGRCAVLFAAEHGYVPDRQNLSFTNAGVPYRAAMTEHGVRISFPDPKLFKLNLTLKVEGQIIPCHFGDVGTPHAVIFVDEFGDAGIRHVDQIDINIWGPAVRNHPDFAPEGANANFVELLPDGEGIRLRTFERGVEGETGACGTGSIAAAIITAMLRELPPPIRVIPTSNSPLRVDFRFPTDHPEQATDLSLEGEAVLLMEGMLNLERTEFAGTEGESIDL